MKRDRSGMWLPDHIAQKKPELTVHRKDPFKLLDEQLRRRGVRCIFQHDEKERTIRVRFLPLTPKVRQAFMVASQSSQQDALEVSIQYGVLDNPGQAAMSCVETGLERLKEVLGS